MIRELQLIITLQAGDDQTCQLFTGHIGCGKLLPISGKRSPVR